MNWDGTYIELYRLSNNLQCVKKQAIYTPYFLIGRVLSGAKETCLNPCNLTINDEQRKISRIHLTITRETNEAGYNQYFIKDGAMLGKPSLRGIFDGAKKRIIYQELQPVDVIYFSGFKLIFIKGKNRIITAQSTL